jgi:hypothetical protein
LDIGALSGFDEPEERYLDRLDEQADRLLGSIDAASNVIGMVLDLQHAKLDVHNRGEAVARARGLRLLGPPVRLVA